VAVPGTSTPAARSTSASQKACSGGFASTARNRCRRDTSTSRRPWTRAIAVETDEAGTSHESRSYSTASESPSAPYASCASGNPTKPVFPNPAASVSAPRSSRAPATSRA
jgi:hypothetical protein